jgi:parvulin-like peptidyl-prolyl isomerase
MRVARTIAGALALVVLMAGCPQGSAPKGTVIVSVNQDKMTKQELDSLTPEGFVVTRDNLPKVLDKWVSNTLLYQEAVRRGLDKEPEMVSKLERLRRDYLVNQLLDRLTESAKPSQEEVFNYFNQHKDEFTYEVKISRIVLPDSAMAAATLAELKAGADFAKLAKERSQDALLQAGQESRYFSRGVGDPRMGGDPELEEAIFGLKVGEYSNIITTNEGYQIVKLLDRKKTKPEVTFAESAEYINAILAYRKSQALVDSVLTALRGTAKIDIKPDAYFGGN